MKKIQYEDLKGVIQNIPEQDTTFVIGMRYWGERKFTKINTVL